MRYILGLGSNIEPVTNLPRMLDALFGLTDTIVVSRIIATAPVGVMGEHFLNCAVSLCSALSVTALKERLRQIEAELGRDMTDPQRKTRSRPADIDILLVLREDAPWVAAAELPQEVYLRPQVLELLSTLGIAFEAAAEPLAAGTALRYGRSWIGTGALTIEERAE